MRTESEIRKGMLDEAEIFRNHMNAERYAAAARCYEVCRFAAGLVGLDQGTVDELFGVRGERGVYELRGAFPEEDYLKAKEMEIFGRRKGRRTEN